MSEMTRDTRSNLKAADQSGRFPDMRRRTLLRSALAVALAVAGGLLATPAPASALKLGELAPLLVLHTLDGSSIATRDLGGQVVIVTFWATWCDPCQEELPLLSEYAALHAKQGLRVLGFSLDGPEDLPKVREVAATLSFPVGLLGSPWAGDYGRIWRIPVSFVIDRSGRLVDNGWDDAQPVWTKERLKQVVDPLLRPK
jgi:cytochrome c biogenesis protein CcmG/thiol:disulfide interchange protein DsbE